MSPFRSTTAIESVAEAERRAKKRLPKPVYVAIVAGTEEGKTLSNNLEAFSEVGLTPRVGVEVPGAADPDTTQDMSTSLLGQDLSLPVVTSPAAAQAIHPEGELPVARATAGIGSGMGHSSFAAARFEDVIAINPRSFIQLYWTGTREVMAERVERFRRAGTKGIILTLDVRLNRDDMGIPRDWGSPWMPERVDLRAALRFAPNALSRPRWLLDFLRHGGVPDLKVPNLQVGSSDTPSMLQGFVDWMKTPLPSWDDVAWLAEQWGGPFMVKGILHPDDARRAVAAGATAISVSNHGGNNVDSTPSPLRYLPAVVDAVGSEAEITLDGGVRRGSDVVKALALGAKAVLIGRPWFYALGAGGERGVREVLRVFEIGIDRTLVSLGKASIRELSPDDVVLPPGFAISDANELPIASR